MANAYQDFINGKGAAAPAPQVDPAQAYKSFVATGTKPVTVSIDPKTRVINIDAPSWYIESPEFQEQVLPEYKKLIGRNIDDNQFKALIDSGMQSDLQEQANQIEKRAMAVQEYKAKFPKATEDDAMTYFRNVAAFENSENSDDARILENSNGTEKGLKTWVDEWKGVDDDRRAQAIQGTLDELNDPNISEKDRAINMSLLQGFKNKGLAKASGTTKAIAAMNSFLTESDKGAIGWVVNNLVDPTTWFGGKTTAEKAREDEKNTDYIYNLEGLEGYKTGGNIAGNVFTTGADIVATAPLGGAAAWTKAGTVASKIPTVSSLAPKIAAVSPSAAVAVDAIPSVASAVKGIATMGAAPGASRVAQVTGGVLRQAPADVAFGAGQAATNSDYNAAGDFALNTALNAATLGGAKAVGGILKSIDTASNGALNRFSQNVGRAGLRGVKNIQSIPGVGGIMGKLSTNFLDESAVVKRSFRNAYATAKGEANISKAKKEYIEVSNAIRVASQNGAPQARAFREGSEAFKSALTDNAKLQKTGLGQQAADYVDKYTVLERARAGQYDMKPEQLDALQTEVDELAALSPELEAYRQKVVASTRDITQLGVDNGILDADLIKYMEDNPEFAKDYVQLQADVSSRKNPYTGAGSSRNLKNTAPVKKIRGLTDEDLRDPFIVMNQRLELTTRIMAQNRVATIVRDGIASGAIKGTIIRNGAEAKTFSDLKFAAATEKEAIEAALNTQLDDLGGALGALTDDVEDLTGAGSKIVNDRIVQAVDEMENVILDSPKLQDEITDLMDKLGEGKEGAEVAAAAGILHRHKADISKRVDTVLQKAELTPSERKMVVDMFKDAITSKFDEAMGSYGRSGRSGARELNERAKEIKRLRAEMGSTRDINQKNVVAFYEDGHKGYMELEDPDLADYFNSRKPPVEDGIIARVMTGASRLFRLGTTGLDPTFSLFVNPLRDVPQAFVAGGTGILTPFNVHKALMEATGMTSQQADDALRLIHDQKAESYDLATQMATGRRGDDVSAKQLPWETNGTRMTKMDKKTYKNMQAEARDNRRGKLKYVINALVPTRALRNAEDVLGNVELVTRSKVYDGRLKAALSRGESLEDAMSEALFYGAEVTTNFLNTGAKTRQFVRTVPYLMAAINGSASFTRLFALDPVGVTVRMLGGIAMPATYLTAQNLKPENQETYYNIPEYTRRTNFIIVMPGSDEYIKIPMSYELAKVVNPFREAVETHHDMNPESFQQIFVKTLLGAVPIDLAGFAERGFNGEVNTQLAAQQALGSFVPQLAKPIVEGLTGKNMYTGSDLNPSDEELINSGAVEPGAEITPGDRTFEKSDSTILRGIANAIGVDQGKINSVVKAYGGTVGQYVLNGLDTLAGAVGADGPVGGKDVAEQIAARFIGGTTKQATTDYYSTIDKLKDEKKMVETRLDRLSRNAYSGDDPGGADAERQRIIDEFGTKVADSFEKYGDYYNRVGGLKPYQVDAVVKLLDFGPKQGAFDQGSYQNDDLQTVRQEATSDANRRAQELGLPDTAARDLYGRSELMDDGSSEISYYDTTRQNGLIRDRVQGAPKQIAFEVAEAFKADRKAGIPSMYEIKKGFDDEISKLYDEAKGLKGAAATAVYDRISDKQEEYMTKAFDVRVRPLIEKYGPEILRNSKVSQEIEAYVTVPGDYTPFASKTKQPYLKDDVWTYIKDRYGVGNMNSQNLKNDVQAEAALKQINQNIQSGNRARANFQLSALQQQIDSGKVYVDSATMDDIAAMIKARNKRR